MQKIAAVRLADRRTTTSGGATIRIRLKARGGLPATKVKQLDFELYGL